MNTSISQQSMAVTPPNLIVHFWLHHTVHCTVKIVSRKGGTVGGAHRVLCTLHLGTAYCNQWEPGRGPKNEANYHLVGSSPAGCCTISC